MGGLGKPGEQFEGLLGGAVLLGDKDCRSQAPTRCLQEAAATGLEPICPRPVSVILAVGQQRAQVAEHNCWRAP